MKMTVIGLFDRKAQVFIEMSATPNTAVALRNLQELVNKPGEHPVTKWPGDFELWDLGEWDSETGMLHKREDASCQYEKKLIINCESLKG